MEEGGNPTPLGETLHLPPSQLPLLEGAAGVEPGTFCCLSSPVYFPNVSCLGIILIGGVNYALSMVTREPVSPVFGLLLLGVFYNCSGTVLREFRVFQIS